MEWIGRKLDGFVAAIFVALAAIASSQAQAFFVQYVQRLGGHLDEARAQLTNVETGLRYKLMSDAVRGEAVAEARHRVDQLQRTYDSFTQANLFTKPVALIRHADTTMLAGTWHDFVPSLPTTAESIIYVIVGMVLGFALYEIVKIPLMALLREPRRRKFRRRT